MSRHVVSPLELFSLLSNPTQIVVLKNCRKPEHLMIFRSPELGSLSSTIVLIKLTASFSPRNAQKMQTLSIERIKISPVSVLISNRWLLIRNRVYFFALTQQIKDAYQKSYGTWKKSNSNPFSGSYTQGACQ